VNWLLEIPLAVRLAALFAMGACVGALVNLGAYQFALDARPISPWSRPAPQAPPRRWFDRLPIVGWLGLRRESPLHGAAFWLRPMAVELACGLGLAALYWWEVGLSGLILPGVRPPSAAALHAQYVCHVVLIGLMLIGSLIDLDERIIPDSVTVPGTLFALAAAALCPWSLLPDLKRLPQAAAMANLLGLAPVNPQPDFLRLTSPNAWPEWLGGFPHAGPLLIGLACWWLWCAALMHRTWYTRHGLVRAVALLLARLRKDQSTGRIVVLGLIGSAGIVAGWFLGSDYWAGLLTALVGMVASGGLVWLVRIIGTAVLDREAMGFGDVTLMGMIGAFLGWQPSLVVFFLAPLAGLVLGLLTLVLRREREIPYGPFLCLAAVLVIVRWAPVWEWVYPVFALGIIVPLVVLACLVLMALMLGIWRLIKERLFA